MRGLDYYNDFCFEYVVKERVDLAQNAIIGGGRYDSLYARMGGAANLNVFSIGFAIGLDRMTGNLLFYVFLRNVCKIFESELLVL